MLRSRRPTNVGAELQLRPYKAAEPYVIMMPPPNVTAMLHMGHGLNNTVQDVLVRFERMRGRAALWLPGTDHAGIATQNVVERLIAQEGKTRFDLGREEFVRRVWAFVRETGDIILQQLQGHRRQRRLVSHLLHPGRGPVPRGARGVRAAVREGADLPRASTSSTGARAASPPCPTKRWRRKRPTGRSGGFRYPLADGIGTHHGGDHPARDDAGRHRRGGAPGRRHDTYT